MATNARYIGYPILTDARDLVQKAFNYLIAKIPGWQPSEGNLDVWILEAAMSEAADIATLASEVPKSIFRYFGSTLFNVVPQDAVAATTTATFTLADANGHTISAGTQVGVRDSAGTLWPFQVVADVVVPGGSLVTGAGAVSLVALVPGAGSSGLGSVGGNIELIDAISWIASIAQVTITAGGADAESDDNYLSRLALELQTMSPRPILPRDFSILSRNVAGVQRAAAVDGYNPADGTFNNERMITIVALDANGIPVGSTVKTAIQNYLDAMREINFQVHTADAVVSQVDVTTHVKLLAGYSAADVQTRIVSAIRGYLSPVSWGIERTDDPNDPQTWSNIAIIRYDDLVWLVRNTAGVDYIIDLTVGLHGGAMSAVDLNLGGVVPLPNPNTITAVAS